MKELSVIEMNEVSGAYSWDMSNGLAGLIGSAVTNAAEAVSSVGLGASVGSMAGAVIGGKHGGDGGGLLGIGSIGQGVGMVAGGILGGVASGVAAAVIGWDTTLEYSKKGLDGLINGTIS